MNTTEFKVFAILLIISVIIKLKISFKEKIKLTITIIIILLPLVIGNILYINVIRPKKIFNDYVLSNIENKYQNYESIKHIKTAKCYGAEGFEAGYIKNCFTSKYKIITPTNEFNIYVNDYKYKSDGKEYYDIKIFYADTKECIENIKHLKELKYFHPYDFEDEAEQQCTMKVN